MTRVVYFARVGEYLKVGASGNLKRRLVELRSSGHRRKQITPESLCDGHPAIVTLIGTIPGPLGREAECKAALVGHRVVGEWYALTPETLGIVARILRAEAVAS